MPTKASNEQSSPIPSLSSLTIFHPFIGCVKEPKDCQSVVDGDHDNITVRTKCVPNVHGITSRTFYKAASLNPNLKTMQIQHMKFVHNFTL